MKRIYLSYGHFGKGTGATGHVNGKAYDEGTMTKELTDMLTCCFMRKDNECNLSEVVRTINRSHIDLALEFHFNAGGGCGSECVVSDRTSKATRNLAARISHLIADTLSIKDRGVKLSSRTPRGRLAFTDDTKCASIIVEVAFVDCADDMAKYDERKADLAKNIDTLLKSI